MNDFAKAFRIKITDEQLNEFINEVIEVVDDLTIEKILSNLNSDIKMIYQESLNPTKNKLILSKDTFETLFRGLLSDINGIVFELGDEDGQYFEAEHHWEAPEFNEYSFSRDLEEVFKKMLPLLSKAYKYESIDSNYFFELIDEIKSGIDEYPEWSGAEYSDWIIEENGAELIIHLLWLNKVSIEEFITNIYKIVENQNIMDQFEPAFIQNLTDNDKKEIYTEIVKHKKEWQDSLNDTKHFLHNILHIVTQVGDKDSFIKESIENINKKWYYGIDVYKYYLELNDYSNSENYIQKTISEFYNQTLYNAIDLNIENTILPFHSNKTDEQIGKVFKDWLSILKTLKNETKYKLITIQYQAYLTPYDYKKLLSTILNNKTEFYDNYINELKTSFVKNSLSYNKSETTTGCWIGNIIDLIINNEKTLFMNKIKQWLGSRFKEPKNCYDHGLDYELLMILTNDLLPSLNRLKKYPIFYKEVASLKRNAFSSINDDLDKLTSFRKQHLKNINVQELENDIFNAWKRNLEQLIPSPKNVHKADYASHAKWLAIAKEINIETYNNIYASWRINHFRRPNLWRELKNYGIVKI